MYFGNDYLQETIYEQTVLNEMHISKKDLSDPDILKKVLEKSEKESNNATMAAMSIPLVLGIAADIVLCIVMGSIGLSIALFLPFIGGACILAVKVIEKIPDFKEQNLKKLKDKAENLKKNALKLKDGKEKEKILADCDKVLKSIEKYHVKEANKKAKEKSTKDRNFIIRLMKVAAGEYEIATEYMTDTYRDYYVADKIGLMKPAELDKVVVNYCKTHKNEKGEYGNLIDLFCGSYDVEGAKKAVGEKEFDKLQKVIPGFGTDGEDVYIFYAIDDTIVFYNRKNSKFYYGDYGADWLKYDSSLYKLAEKCGGRDGMSEITKEDIENYKSIYEELKQKK